MTILDTTTAMVEDLVSCHTIEKETLNKYLAIAGTKLPITFNTFIQYLELELLVLVF